MQDSDSSMSGSNAAGKVDRAIQGIEPAISTGKAKM
jgi:hypothetical protein